MSSRLTRLKVLRFNMERYVIDVNSARFDILRRIEQLDPERDHQRIVHLSFGYDFLYVLSTFIYEPIRWIDAFGWRQTCPNERLGYYCFWREIGKRVGIVRIPPSYEAFEAWSRAYEREHFRFADTNQRVGTVTRDLFGSWFPRVFTPLVRYSIYAMLDADMIMAFGFPKPLPLTRPLLRGMLKLRGHAVRWLPPRRSARFFTNERNRTYPEGYRISRLGPARLVAAETKRSDLLE